MPDAAASGEAGQRGRWAFFSSLPRHRKGHGMRTINVGILGMGTIGSGVVKVLQDNSALLDLRVGARLRIQRIAVIRTPPRIPVDPKLLTTNAMEVIKESPGGHCGGVDRRDRCCPDAVSGSGE